MRDLHPFIENLHNDQMTLEAVIKTLRKHYGGLSSAMIQSLKVVYGWSYEQLEPLIRWVPRLKGEPSSEHKLIVCDHCLHHQNELKERLMFIANTEPLLEVTFGGCLGACDRGPNALLDGQLYTQIDHDDSLWQKLTTLTRKK